MRLALAVALVACSKSSPPQPPPSPAPPAAAIPADAAVDATTSLDPAPWIVMSRQVVTAIVPDWSSTRAELRLWTRDGGAWKLAMGPWPGVVGASGTGWGIGLHGSGAFIGRSGPVKREGDGKSPAGVFAIRASYGYAASAKTALPYRTVDEHWKCVDDPSSRSYTRILDQRTVKPDWASAEDMRRGDALYEWVVELVHNGPAQPGGGSCIFLHVWSGPQSSTVGCTAMDEGKLVALLERLAPGALFVLLPQAEYTALAPAWGLP